MAKTQSSNTKAAKRRKATAKVNRSIKQNQLQTDLYKSKTKLNQAKAAERQSRKGKSYFERRRESTEAKHNAHLREINAKAQMAEQKPGIYKANVESENKLKMEKARAQSKAASSTALATGMATLGKGLSDENNQDQKFQAESDERIMRTIFGNQTTSKDEESSDYGLAQGVE